MPRLLERLGLWPACLIALSCTGLLALGAPPGGTTFLIWLSFIPVALVVQLPQFSPRRAAFVGWFGGLGAGLFGFPWVAELLERFAGFSWAMSLFSLFVFSAWTAVQWAIWGYGLRRGPRGGWQRLVWGCILWVFVASTWPAIFPYTAVLGLAEQPVWIQAAELGGTAAVELQIVAVGILGAHAVVASGRERWRHAGLAVGIFVLSTGLGAWRMASIDGQMQEARSVRFGVVQPNIPLRWRDQEGRMNRLRGMSRKAQDDGAQVVLWPEAGVYPFGVTRPFERDSTDPRRRVLLEHSLPTIFGAPSRDRGARFPYNSVFNMARDGTVKGSFDKVHLMPFGEYVPVVDPLWAKKQLNTLNHNLRGAGPSRFEVIPPEGPLRVDGQPFFAGPLVCYEDIFPSFARKTAAQEGGVDVFLNHTIDTWFGDTAEPWEHLALAQFRSVEHRIPMVRSVSAGPSTVVDANGRVIAKLDAYGPTVDDMPDAEVLVHDVPLPRNTDRDPTIYGRFGWLLAPLCQVSVLGLVLARIFRSRYRPARIPPLENPRGNDSEQ